jgi:hypothetical protein
VGVPIGALLLLGGCGTLAVLAVNAFTGAIGPATQATEEYATALVEQRWDDAREMLCDEVRPALTPGDLAELYGDPRLVRYEVTGIEVNSSSGRSTGQATITFITETGLKDPTFLRLVKDGDDWRPCP